MRISVDGRRIRNNKVVFSNLSGIVWTGPKNLTWEDHVDHMRNKINQKLGLLRRIKSCLPLSAGITFLILMFYPFLIMVILYGETGATLLLWPNNKYYQTRPRESFWIFTLVLLQAIHLESSTAWKLFQRRRAEHRDVFISLSTSQLTTFLYIRSTSRSIAVSITKTQDRSITSEIRLHLEDGDTGLH